MQRVLPVTLLLLLLGFTAAHAQEDETADATRTVPAPADDDEYVPEAPHYYRWVDAKGRLNFSDIPPEGKNIKVLKAPLDDVPDIGTGDNLTHAYQQATDIMQQPIRPDDDVGAPVER